MVVADCFMSLLQSFQVLHIRKLKATSIERILAGNATVLQRKILWCRCSWKDESVRPSAFESSFRQGPRILVTCTLSNSFKQDQVTTNLPSTFLIPAEFTITINVRRQLQNGARGQSIQFSPFRLSSSNWQNLHSLEAR